MSLRLKFVLFVSVLLLIFAASSYLVQEKTIFPRYLEYEKEMAVISLDRVVDVIGGEIGHVDNICADWAIWDASFDFVRSRDQNFVKENLEVGSFKNAKVNLIIFLDNQYRTVFNKAYDYNTLKEIEINDLSAKVWGRNHYLIPKIVDKKDMTKNFIVGMINTSKGILVISSRLILNSDGQGPARGVLIVGKFLEQISPDVHRQSKVDFKIIRDYKNISGIREIEKDNYFVMAENDNFIHVYKAVRDTKGDIIFVLECEIPRKFYKNFVNSLRYSQASTVIFTVLLFFALLMIQRIFIFRPLADLKRHMRSIQGSGDYSKRIGFKIKDEFGSFANSFNKLLETIERQNMELQSQAQTDPLTGLFNRRYLEEALKIEIGRAIRMRSSCSIVIFDIDYFKSINDKHGHDGGDYVLSCLADVIRKKSRQGDIVARYGGEEFLIFLPNAEPGEAYILAERMRETIEYVVFSFNGERVPVTISSGCASFPEHGENYQAIITRADNALYRAKQKGRNRVEMA